MKRQGASNVQLMKGYMGMQTLFKGYVPTKDKKCLMPFKNASSSDLRTYEQVKSLPEFAGIIDEDVILIDVDDYDQSEILMDMVEDLQLRCRVYQTTRGKHFFFMNKDPDGNIIQPTCKVKKASERLACGLDVDIKVGCKNSYSILKFNGKEREIIYDIFPDEEYESVPKWLLPVKSNTDFLSMESGDGRNQALFNYILTLQSCEFSIDEIKQTIKLINDYILPDKLDENELDTILRDEAFKKPIFFNKSGTFLFDKFANYIRANNHVIKVNDQMHIYKDGIYVNGQKYIEAEMIKHISKLNRSKRAEVLSYLDIMIGDSSPSSDANLIAFRNGIYNIETDELLPFSSEYVILNKIDFDYIPDAYNETADKTLDKLACFDPEIRSLLEEVIGYTFYRRNELRKSFILIGDKANGKSTYLDMIKTLLGDRNTAALDLKELGDRFKTAELFGKLANIGDDIGDEFIPNPAAFKKLVSGDRLNVERKGQDPFDFNNYSKLLFSANNIPRIKDKSGAVIDRLVIIPFNARFSADDPDYDPYIKYKLRKPESMEYLIQLGIAGLKNVLKNRRFTSSIKVEKELEEYEENNNPILLFFKEEPKIENEPTNSVYAKYSEFCLANSFNPMSKIEFSKQVKKRFDFDIVDKTIRGKKYRIFIRKEEQR